MADCVQSPKLRGQYKGYVGAFCCAPGCSNSRGESKRLKKQISFYRFPSDEKRKQQWLYRIRRDVVLETPEGKKVTVPFQPNKNTRICSEHFVGGKKLTCM